MVIILMGHDGTEAYVQISLFMFEFCKRFDAAEMEGSCHAHLHALWIAAAQVALGRSLNGIIYLHVPERACRDTQPASVADLFVNDNGRRLRIMFYRIDRTHIHTESVFALKTSAGLNPSPVHVHIYKYIGTPTFFLFCLLKQAGAFAAQSGDTTIEFNKYNVHSVRLHYGI